MKRRKTNEFGLPFPRKFVLKHSPFKFNGKIVYQYTTIEAYSCGNAVYGFRTISPDHAKAQIVAVKAAQSLQWRYLECSSSE